MGVGHAGLNKHTGKLQRGGLANGGTDIERGREGGSGRENPTLCPAPQHSHVETQMVEEAGGWRRRMRMRKRTR